MMEQSLTRYERLDMYLDQLASLERSRRQKQWFLSAIIALTFIGISSTFFITPRPVAQQLTTFTPELRRFLADSLNPEKVQHLFVEEASALVILHADPLLGIDTVASLDEYYQLLNEITLSQVDQPEPVDPAYLPTFALQIEGEKMVNQPLTYTIEGFDPSYELILDFGNGIERTAKNATTTYAYPLPGHFDMHLVLNTPDTTMIIQTLKYQILPNDKPVAQNGRDGEGSVAQSR